MKYLDWHGLMVLGLHHLQLSSDEFWNLTPAELLIKLGRSNTRNTILTRAGMDMLLARFPDEKVKE